MEPAMIATHSIVPDTSFQRPSDAWTNPRATARAQRATEARKQSGRRRNIDPTTCDREYSAAELEFMKAMRDYTQRSGRKFPTFSEILEVVRELGYAKVPNA
jgi:hypothetical protein